MHPEVEKHIPAIRALCAELGVSRLELCEGDSSTPDAAMASPCFIVTTPDTENPGLWAEKLVELEERLSSLLGREIDLLLPGALRNDWVRTHIATYREELYRVGQ